LIGACEETQGSPYYNCNTLAQALKIGMSREEVIAIFGQPTEEFAPGDSHDYWCLEYRVYAPKIRQKVGERSGFQVLFQDKKLIRWSSILSSTDADDSDCAWPPSTPCES
jgi:outer membrane protein assembly factor BamE (lipoprotein component of BamABCDE complex)